MTKMNFEAIPVVWISIAAPVEDREPYKVFDDQSEKIGEFMQWLYDNKIFGHRTTTTGGGQYHGCFYEDEWPRVEAWLLEHGFTPGPYERFQ